MFHHGGAKDTKVSENMFFSELRALRAFVVRVLFFYLPNNFLVQPESSSFFMKLLSTMTLASKRARSG